MSGPESLVERLENAGAQSAISEMWPYPLLREAAAELSTLREQAAKFAAMSNRDALAALKLESERDALRARCDRVEAERDGWLRIVGQIVAQVPLPAMVKAAGTSADIIAFFKEQRRELDALRAARDEAMRALEDVWNNIGEMPVDVMRRLRARVEAARALQPSGKEMGE